MVAETEPELGHDGCSSSSTAETSMTADLSPTSTNRSHRVLELRGYLATP